eukprot:g6034.t1
MFSSSTLLPLSILVRSTPSLLTHLFPDFLDNFRTTGICGHEATGVELTEQWRYPDIDNTTITSVQTGSNLTVNWALHYAHQGGWLFELYTADGELTSTWNSTDHWDCSSDSTQQEAILRMPDTPCENCVLRLRRQALEWGAGYRFHSCALVNITDDPDDACNGCSGNGRCRNGRCRCFNSPRRGFWYGDHCQNQNECDTDAHCGEFGVCVDTGNITPPNKQCYCREGYFGTERRPVRGSNMAVRTCTRESNLTLGNPRQWEDEYDFMFQSPGRGDFQLFYTLDEENEEIEFAIRARTSNWVAIGFRPIATSSTGAPDTADGEQVAEGEAAVEGEGGRRRRLKTVHTMPQIQSEADEVFTQKRSLLDGHDHDHDHDHDSDDSHDDHEDDSVVEPVVEPVAEPNDADADDDEGTEGEDTGDEFCEEGDPTIVDYDEGVHNLAPLSLQNSNERNLKSLSMPNLQTEKPIKRSLKQNQSNNDDEEEEDTADEEASDEDDSDDSAATEPSVSPDLAVGEVPAPVSEGDAAVDDEDQTTYVPELIAEGTECEAVAVDPAAHPMINQDVIIAYAKDGIFRIQDSFTPSRAKPLPDSFFNGDDGIIDAVGTQSGRFTNIKFRRRLNSVDGFGDYCILPEVNYWLIYAYGQNPTRYSHDPPSGLETGRASNEQFYGEDELKYHGGGIGTTYEGRGSFGRVNFFDEPTETRQPGEGCLESTMDGYDCMVSALGGDYIIHWTVEDDGVAFACETSGTGWVGIGWPETPGVMVGSQTVIGLGGGDTGSVGVYLLEERAPSGITEDNSLFEIEDGEIETGDDSSVLRFKRLFDDEFDGEGEIDLVVAFHASSNEIEYHGTTRANLSSPDDTEQSSITSQPHVENQSHLMDSEDLTPHTECTNSSQGDPCPEMEKSAGSSVPENDDAISVKEEELSESSKSRTQQRCFTLYSVEDRSGDPEQTVEFSFLSATETIPEDYQTAYGGPSDDDGELAPEQEATVVWKKEPSFQFEFLPQLDNEENDKVETKEANDEVDTNAQNDGVDTNVENDEGVTDEECVRIDIASESAVSDEESKCESVGNHKSVASASAVSHSLTPPASEVEENNPEDPPDAQEITREADDTPSELKEQHNELYMKKNFWTDFLLSWKRFRNTFHFSLWSTRIQAVEGKHGSNVGITLYFLRWILYLNLVISALWIMFTVVPFIAYPPSTFSWDLFAENNATELLNGKALGRTWFLYGGYEYPLGTKHGAYEPGIVFPLAACLTLFLSLLSLLNVIGKRIAGEGDSSVIEQNQTYPFSSVVFASWDFHMDDIHSVWNLKNAIRSQIREMLKDAEWSQRTTTLKGHLLNGATKIIGTMVFWPATVCVTAAAMFYAVGNGDLINEYFGFSFAQSITITLVSLAGQFLVRFTVKYEGWHPRVAQQVETTKLFSVKVINLGVILYTIYNIQLKAADATQLMMESGVQALDHCANHDANSCEVGLVCCDQDCIRRFGMEYKGYCVPVCEENEMGMIFYRLVLTNGFILSLQEVVQALVMTHCFKTRPHMDAAKFFVNIVDTQALVWLGSIVAPLLPLFGVLSNVTTFYIKSWLALSVYDPPRTTCSAARNSNMQYNLTLLALLFCALPITSLLYEDRDICGPNTGQSMADALSKKISRSPRIVKTLIRWVTNPVILGGALFALAFFFLLERVRKAKWKKKATESKIEFSRYRHDMQLKLAETRSKTASPVSATYPRQQSFFNYLR